MYKVGSKNRLAKILCVDVADILRLAQDAGNFKVFELPEETCEFTGKVKKARWVQDPVPELKAIHRRIQSLLSRVVVPSYCHGGTKGKSYRSNAAAHVGAPAVATFDLKSFFPSTTAKQVFGFFQNDLLCAPDVAGLLTDLCTYQRVLPTGSPVSPILAFWANQKLFSTLDKRSAEQDLQVSVYVDDVTISGNTLPRSLIEQVDGIVQKHGHKLSQRKTKCFGPGAAKHVTGVVIHRGALKVPYSRFKKARAISQAIKNASDDGEREKLTAQLSGLLGEAAYIDKSYRRWATNSYAALAKIRARRAAAAL